MRKEISRIPKIMTICMMLLLTLSLCACEPLEIDVHIFADMEECLNIEIMEADEAEVDIFDPTKKDWNLRGLEVEESFGCEYISDDLKFTLYAYVFPDSDLAMEYYKNETGKNNDPNPTFSSSAGMNSYIRIVVSENRAYIARCSKSHSEKLIEFLNSRFSEEVYSTSE